MWPKVAAMASVLAGFVIGMAAMKGASAADHRDAPALLTENGGDKSLDINDVYVFQSPANHKHTLGDFSEARIEDLIACFGMGLRIGYVPFLPTRQTHGWVVHVADCKNHRVHVEFACPVGYFSANASIPVHQNIFSYSQTRNPAVWAGRDRNW